MTIFWSSGGIGCRGIRGASAIRLPEDILFTNMLYSAHTSQMQLTENHWKLLGTRSRHACSRCTTRRCRSVIMSYVDGVEQLVQQNVVDEVTAEALSGRELVPATAALARLPSLNHLQVTYSCRIMSFVRGAVARNARLPSLSHLQVMMRPQIGLGWRSVNTRALLRRPSETFAFCAAPYLFVSDTRRGDTAADQRDQMN